MAPTTLPSLESVTLDNTVGALFTGVLAAVFLFGVTTLNMYWYYHLYPKDNLLHKWAVAVLWVLDTLHVALTIHAVYSYIVKGFGSLPGLEEVIWSIKLQVLVNVLIILLVHSLYALRVWILGEIHHGIVGYFVAFIVLGGFAIGIVLAYQTYTVDTFAEIGRISWIINSAFATATGIDFVITAAMFYYLWKSRIVASRLDSRISTVMQYTLSSGLLTSACSLSALFCYILLPNTFVFLGLEFILTKLYVLSFLSLLNARQHLPATDPPSRFISVSDPKFVRMPMTERRHQGVEDKFTPPIKFQPSSERYTNRKALRKTTSSFWSPPPPISTQFDEERGYKDYLPANLSVDQSIGDVGSHCERSLSDESETVKGASSPTSPDSTTPLVIQRPPTVYYDSAEIPKVSSQAKSLSTSSYPWHAR
ncbi:hypothetical protein AGABI1DRAFT_132898 [Agaricus bisporus var. burnettii JB137-S8]|uniref:DUF6534 domain-containing protein n=1 Tax=Agaricus bisporus var. burnettii (strain JB137-S8 / ATCC MYA-4627 / FGSC 10392) TaxID=597362 RepID=K5WHN1_AGABU|nr:uncharacterized protein AGABI1DRAFT_132898 [Agaricus bisporus var. burnettii JB137-S8]EKM74781.1 hypothetical protein AGABI1DRAFT_132898 [Agaricus bisporus var. burnettii JB137-S8]